MGLRDLFKRNAPKASDQKAHEPRASPAGQTPGKRPEAPIGGHWGILYNTAEEVQNMCMETAMKGNQVAGAPSGDNKTLGIMLPEGLFTLVCIAEECGRILTFYPMAEGKKHRAVFRGAFPDIPGAEGAIQVTMGDATFNIFDTMYFKEHAAYEAGKNYDFAIAGIAYSLARTDEKKVKDRDGRELSMKGMAAFFPARQDVPDDYLFHSPVKKIEQFEANGHPILRLTVTLFRLPGDDAAYGDVDIYLYVRQDRLNGYVPAVGDDVTGTLWLLGYRV